MVINELIPNVSVPEGTSGPWSVVRFTVSRADSKRTAMHAMMNGGRGYVPHGTYTKLTRDGQTIMSDTPDEKRDHMSAVQMANGHCIINGLGLGMVLQAVLAKKEVKRVTVVELSPDVISLVAGHYTDPRVEIVNASAFTYSPVPGVRYGMVWHDIWDEITSENLGEMTKLKRKYGRRCDWQGAWGESICRRMAREWKDLQARLEVRLSQKFGDNEKAKQAVRKRLGVTDK